MNLARREGGKEAEWKRRSTCVTVRKVSVRLLGHKQILHRGSATPPSPTKHHLGGGNANLGQRISKYEKATHGTNKIAHKYAYKNRYI
jgi:hypothetical protein